MKTESKLHPPGLILCRIMLFIICASAFVLFAGCAFTIVPPETAVIPATDNAPEMAVRYPMRVITHHSESFWDLHQVKRNIQGLMDTQFVRMFDIAVDTVIPAPEIRPLESGIEGLKYSWAMLPDRAPVRITGDLFHALGIEKLSISRGYYFFPRMVYLTDWVQRGLGEANQLAGLAVPGGDRLIPVAVTTPINSGVDGAQSGLIGAYIFVFGTIDQGLDALIDGLEATYAGVIWVCAWPFYRNSAPLPESN